MAEFEVTTPVSDVEAVQIGGVAQCYVHRFLRVGFGLPHNDRAVGSSVGVMITAVACAMGNCLLLSTMCAIPLPLKWHP